MGKGLKRNFSKGHQVYDKTLKITNQQELARMQRNWNQFLEALLVGI